MTTGSASTRIITRPDEKERAALVCSACASGLPMWAAISRSNRFAVPARKSRCSFPCRQVPQRLNELTYETNFCSADAAHGQLECCLRRTRFDQLGCGESHSAD